VEMHSYSPVYTYNNIVLEKADLVLVHCDDFKNRLSRKEEYENLQVVHMGCKENVEFDIEKIKENLGIKGAFPIIGSFGFMREQKGYKQIVEILKVMKEDYPDVMFLLVAPKHEFGSPSYVENFYKFVEDMDLQNSVIVIREFMPEQKLLKTLACADLFVLNYQGSPAGGGNSAAVKTIMRVQRPIITTDTLYFKDLEEDTIFKMKKPITKQTMQSAIKKMIEDPLQRKKYIDNANKFLKENSWKNIAKQHIDLYKGVSNG